MGTPFRTHVHHRRKKEARQAHEQSAKAQKLHGLKAKLYNKKRHAEKVQMKKTYVSVSNPPMRTLRCACLDWGSLRW